MSRRSTRSTTPAPEARAAAPGPAASRGGPAVGRCPHFFFWGAGGGGGGGGGVRGAPPIREAQRDALWEAVLRGDVDYIASDHSPSTLALKQGAFTSAWG